MMTKTEILLGYVRRFPNQSASEIIKIVHKDQPKLKFSDTLVYDAMNRYRKEIIDKAFPPEAKCEKSGDIKINFPNTEKFSFRIGRLVDACEMVGGIDDAIKVLEIIKKGGSK